MGKKISFRKIKVSISTRLLAYFLFVTILPLLFLALTSTYLLNSSLNDKLIKELNIKNNYVWKIYSDSMLKLRDGLDNDVSSGLIKHLYSFQKNHSNSYRLKEELKTICKINNLNMAVLLDNHKKPVAVYFDKSILSNLSSISSKSFSLDRLSQITGKNEQVITNEIISLGDLVKLGIIDDKNLNSKLLDKLGLFVQAGLKRIIIEGKPYYFLAGQAFNRDSKFFKEISNIDDTSIFIVQNNRVILSNINEDIRNSSVEIGNISLKPDYFDKQIIVRDKKYRSIIYNLKNAVGVNISSLIIAIPESYVSDLRYKNSALLFEVALLVAFAGIALAYILARTITKPLSQVTDAARTIEAGDFSSRLNIDNNDELGYLAETFNNMAIALEKRKELEQMKEDLVSTLTHDLRVPLLASVQTLEYLLKGSYGELNDKQEFIADQLIINQKDLLNMVNTILDSYKYEAGKQTLVKRKTNLNKLIDECIFELEALLNEKKHVINFLPYSDNIEIIADRQEIKRVIINLLSNAITYTNPEGKIDIATCLEKNEIIVSIKDNGIGISENSLNDLFKRYSRGSRTLRKIGTGLGLYLSKQIIESHEGRIWVESIKDQGSTFYFSIPVKNEVEDGR